MKTAIDKTQLNIDSVKLGEVTIDNISHQENPILIAKFAYVGSVNGTRHGYFSKSAWSPRVWEKFTAFVDALEDDGLEEAFGQAPSTSGGSVFTDTSDGIPGL